MYMKIKQLHTLFFVSILTFSCRSIFETSWIKTGRSKWISLVQKDCLLEVKGRTANHQGIDSLSTDWITEFYRGSSVERLLESRLSSLLACLAKLVSSFTRRSTVWIACITVVWSRPPKYPPISCRLNLVRRRASHIQTCRGSVIDLWRRLDCKSLRRTL